jgi:hypothetical protein
MIGFDSPAMVPTRKRRRVLIAEAWLFAWRSLVAQLLVSHGVSGLMDQGTNAQPLRVEADELHGKNREGYLRLSMVVFAGPGGRARLLVPAGAWKWAD